MKLFKFFLNAKKNNKGYSLVEVIVAMLVLALAAIPLLMGFSVVSKSNVNTRQRQYANTVAINVIEAIKQFGIENTALQMHEKDNFRLISGISRNNYGESLNDFTTKLVYGSINTENNPLGVNASIYPYPGGNAFKFMPRLETKEGLDDYNNNYVRKYYFFINGIQEGTMMYDAHITFDATPAEFQGTGTKNDFDLSNLGTLNSKKTALIAPSGVWYSTIADENGEESYDITKTFESEALKTFIERYFEYQSSRFNKARELATLTNEIVRKAINSYRDKPGFTIDADNFNNMFANYLFTQDHLNGQKNMADHGSTGLVTQSDIDRSVSLRREAFNYYKQTFPDEWAEAEEKGVTLDPETTVIVDVDAITEQQFNPLQVQRTDGDLYQKFITLVERSTNVNIALENTSYVVNSQTVFTLNQDSFVAAGTPLVCDGDASEEVKKNATTYTGEGYFENVLYTALENIYIFQDAARSGNFKSDTVYINTFELGDSVTILNSYGDTATVNLYMVWQYESVNADGTINSPTYSDNVNIVFGGTVNQAKQFKIYSKTHPGFTALYRSSATDTPIPNASLVESVSGIVSDLDKADRAYTVTVTVLEHGTDTVVYTQSTTIKE